MSQKITGKIIIKEIFISSKEPLQTVDTNIGNMPIEDYREIRAIQSGYDSYEEMYRDGVRLGGAMDKEPILDRAKRYLDEFCNAEYGHGADFSKLDSVNIVYSHLNKEFPAKE